MPAGGDPNALVIDPSGRYLYVAEADSSINAFDIDLISGALTPLPGSPFQTINNRCTTTITSMADLFGRFLYASDGFSFLAISGFSIGRTTGTLTEVPGSPFPDPSRNLCDSAQEISGLTTEPTGRFLYVGFIDDAFFPPHNTIQKFAIDAGNGVLRHVNNTAFNYGGYNGGELAVDPSGKYLYTSSDIGVIGFSINSVTGDLTVLPGSPFSKLPSVMQDLIVTH